MPLSKVRIEVREAGAGHAAAEALGGLAEPTALAVTLFEHGAWFLIEAYYDAAPALGDIERALAPLGDAIGKPTLEAVAAQNWVAVSQAALPPVAAGRFVVHASHDRARLAMRQHAIEIEAGEAFGTGHNATTAGCLDALDKLTRRRRFARVLDLGCGSGVLAIAAARTLPAARVLASDSDPIATGIARANVRLNRVASRVRVITAAGLRHAALRSAADFDLILANILPGTLRDLAPDLHRALRPGGAAVLSGILRHQAREVRACYLARGFRLVRTLEAPPWTVLTLVRG
jgi:ribosomal protein L11 methyltransferase